MKDIFIEEFNEKYRIQLSEFILSEHQLNYTNVPEKILGSAIENINSIPFVVLNDCYDVIGFFVLEKYYEYPGFAIGKEAVFIRSLSINERYQGEGYGKKLILSLPHIVQKYIDDISDLYLVVDFENTIALNLYEEAGFNHIASKEFGSIGEERLYNIDLNHTFVNQITLSSPEVVSTGVIININNSENFKIGSILGEINDNIFTIKNIEINKVNRNKSIAINSLRKLPTILRKHSRKIDIITMCINKNFSKNKLAVYSNFVKVKDSGEQVTFLKYIK